MSKSEEHWQRVEALERMAQDPGAVPALVAVLTEDEKECWHTKTAAIRSLVVHREGGAAILKTLARDGDPDVRECAIAALGELGFAQARRLLERIAGDENDPLRIRAREALAKL